MSLTQEEKQMFECFMAQFRFCWACGADGLRRDDSYTPGLIYPRKLANHHIVGGSGRKHFRWNLSRLCRLCHDLHHGESIRLNDWKLPVLAMNNILWLKRYHDPDWYRPRSLHELRHHAAEPIRPHYWFEREYTNRIGHGYVE